QTVDEDTRRLQAPLGGPGQRLAAGADPLRLRRAEAAHVRDDGGRNAEARQPYAPLRRRGRTGQPLEDHRLQLQDRQEEVDGAGTPAPSASSASACSTSTGSCVAQTIAAPVERASSAKSAPTARAFASSSRAVGSSASSRTGRAARARAM